MVRRLAAGRRPPPADGGSLFEGSGLEGDVPMRLEQLESTLLLALERLLVLEQPRGNLGVAVLLHRLPVPERDRHEDVPVSASVAVESRGRHLDSGESPRG